MLHFASHSRLTKRGKLLTRETKTWLGCDGKVTLLAEPTFLHINTSARPAWLTRSTRDNQSMRECCFRQIEHAAGVLLARAKGPTFFVI